MTNYSQVFTDDSIMPFGMHSGKKMKDVPDSYLLWLYHEKSINDSRVKQYIEDNLDNLGK